VRLPVQNSGEPQLKPVRVQVLLLVAGLVLWSSAALVLDPLHTPLLLGYRTPVVDPCRWCVSSAAQCRPSVGPSYYSRWCRYCSRALVTSASLMVGPVLAPLLLYCRTCTASLAQITVRLQLVTSGSPSGGQAPRVSPTSGRQKLLVSTQLVPVSASPSTAPARLPAWTPVQRPADLSSVPGRTWSVPSVSPGCFYSEQPQLGAKRVLHSASPSSEGRNVPARSTLPYTCSGWRYPTLVVLL
jgi:hypothetical protein